MKNVKYLALAVLILTATANAANESEWQLDAAHSSVAFSVKHLGISKVTGSFKEFSGKILADDATGKITAIEGEVKVKSVNTGIDARDNHLKAADFFDAEKFPTMKLKTTSIVIKGSEITAVADLTIKNTTKSVTFKGEFLGARAVDMGQGKTMRAGYSVSTIINRQDFGLKFNKLAEGVSVVGDEVKITLEAEIFKAIK